MVVYQDVPEKDVMMHDASLGDDHGAGFGTSSADNASIMTMLQDMQMRQDERYVEDCQRRDAFEAT